MIRQLAKFKIILIIFCTTLLFSNSQEYIKLEKLSYNNISYINLNEFVHSHEMHSKYYETKDKIEITFKKNKLYLSPQMSFLKINDKVYNLLHPVITKKNQYYIPAQTFYESLENANLPHRFIKEDKKYIYVIPSIFNITDLVVEQKQNGVLLQLKTTEKFSLSNISSSISSSN